MIHFNGDTSLLVANEDDLDLDDLTVYAVLGSFTTDSGDFFNNYVNSPEAGWSLKLEPGVNANIYWWSSPTYDRTWSTVAASGYHIIAATLSKTADEKTVYIDGTESIQSQDITTGFGATYTNATVTIGKRLTSYFTGNIAEILVYSSVDAKQQAQVQAYLYGKYWLPSSDPAVLIWEDQSGAVNSHDAYINGTDSGYATLTNVTVAAPAGPKEMIHFDGAASLLVANENDLDLDDLTVYAVLGSFTTDSGDFFNNYVNSPEAGWTLKLEPGGNIYWWSSPTYDRTWSTVAASGYHIIAATLSKTADEKTVYIDGTESIQSQDITTGFGATYTNATVSIGKKLSSFFTGDIAEILVYDSVDTNQQAQVEAYLYNKYWVEGGASNTTMGTPHVWIDQYYTTNDYENADIQDTDGDGLLTWQEYIAGTDPTNSASVFKIIDLGYQSASNYITWYGTTNGADTPFGVYRATNLVIASPWLFITNVVRASTGTNLYWDEALPLGVPIFYQITATN